MKKIYESIAERRKACGLKQRDVARFLGLKNHTSISRKEKGETPFSPDELAILSSKLDVGFLIDDDVYIFEKNSETRAAAQKLKQPAGTGIVIKNSFGKESGWDADEAEVTGEMESVGDFERLSIINSRKDMIIEKLKEENDELKKDYARLTGKPWKYGG
jgi:transcriptional regulator with XRE-family HTH domain